MNDYSNIQPRRRNRTLLVVEGKSEKSDLFKTLLKVFPEIEIDDDDIWVYETNIYKLYNQIEKEYDGDFTEIDLPLLITRHEKKEKAYKKDFANIYLIFDYECQDSSFSIEKICKLQECFCDSSDNGQLYINYPMLESYLEIKEFPTDDTYKDAKVDIKYTGTRYKTRFNKAELRNLMNLPTKIARDLENIYHINSTDQVLFTKDILSANYDDLCELKRIICKYIHDQKLQLQAENHIASKLKVFSRKGEYTTYLQCIRWRFQRIIYHNICKANKLLHQEYNISDDDILNAYANLDLKEILCIQNEFCLSDKCIWILNTCVFFIIEYNKQLLFQDMPAK